MIRLFKNINLFTVTFFVILFVDTLVKINLGFGIYRVITKVTVIALLLVYYLINQKEVSKWKFSFMVLALLFFITGDIFLLFHTIKKLYMIGMCCFILGKMFYIFRFANRKDFDLLRLFPFIILIFVYMVGVLFLILNELDNYFYIALAYFFMVLTVIIFSLLRKNEVSKKSYILVLVGVFFSLFSDTIAALKSFYDSGFAYPTITIMLFYGLSQYFIVIGVVKETNFKVTK